MVNEVSEIQRYLVDIRPQLKLLPNSIDIEADDLLEAKEVNRELLLRRQLKPVLGRVRAIIIDTPPAMRAPTVNAFVVADSVIIPIDSSSFALLGMNQLLKTIAAISETYCETTFRCSAAFLQGIYAERNSGRRKTRWELNPVEEVKQLLPLPLSGLTSPMWSRSIHFESNPIQRDSSLHVRWTAQMPHIQPRVVYFLNGSANSAPSTEH